MAATMVLARRNRERVATDGAGVVSRPESPDMLDATAKSSKEHGDLWRWQRQEDDRRWCLVSTRRGGSAGALEGWQALRAGQMTEDEKFCRRALMNWKMTEDERLLS